MRTARILVSVVLAALAVPAAAHAGCAATVGLEPPPPDLRPGQVWHADMLVRQHGVRPLPNALPTLTIVDDDTGERRTFGARKTDTVGMYRAKVVFPNAGEWRYQAYDGFVAKDGSWSCAGTHTFPAVAIGVPGGGGSAGSGEEPAVKPVAKAADAPPAPAAADGRAARAGESHREWAFAAAAAGAILLAAGLAVASVAAWRRASRRRVAVPPRA